MKWITLGIALILSGCGGSSGTTDTAPVVNSPPVVLPPAPPPPPPPAPTPPPPPAAPVVVFIGDSVTSGWSFNTPWAINAGVPGQTSAQMLARFQTDVLAENPSVVVILAGTNDVRHTTNPTIDNIQQMADLAAHAGISVIIGEIPPVGLWDTTDVISDPIVGNALVLSWNAQLVMMAKASGYRVLDYYDAMILPSGLQNTALFLDGIHPNSAGYGAMWGVLKPELVKLGIPVG